MHQDTFHTKASNNQYRNNYNKIDWSKKLDTIQEDKQEVDEQTDSDKK